MPSPGRTSWLFRIARKPAVSFVGIVPAHGCRSTGEQRVARSLRETQTLTGLWQMAADSRVSQSTLRD